jgi:SWI/SNF-related matrix-associated actin-dependent regulator 1 of chromatin subfamily A
MKILKAIGDKTWRPWVTGSVFYAESSYSEKDIVKTAGFWWHPEKKVWWTDKPEIAGRLVNYATNGAKAELEAIIANRQATVDASRASTSSFEPPAPDGLSYMPFQKAGVDFLVKNKSVLLADDMGIGKTIQALGLINSDESIKTIMVVCPASLKNNWSREASKWLTRKFEIGIADTKHAPNCNFIIINYDALRKLVPEYEKTVFDLLIVDEAHALKNKKTQRSQAVEKLRSRRRIYLTGTPIVNRPSELWNLLTQLDPVTWPQKRWWWFVNRYCECNRTKWGLDVSGANMNALPELQEKLRSSGLMIRRTKAQVLTELPPKRRQVIEIDPDTNALKVIEKEQLAAKEYEKTTETLRCAAELSKADGESTYSEIVKQLKKAASVAFGEMSTVRHETALAKVPAVIEYLNDCLESESKIVVMAWHHDVILRISAAFPNSVTLTGETSLIDRQAAVDRFQTDPSCNIFIGSITAAGVGLTLTAASHVVFAELDWVPGNVSQAEDRCHRIGQMDTVLVTHLVLSGSLDATMANIIVAKQEIIDAAMDKQTNSDPIEPTEQPATANLTAKRVREESILLNDDQCQAIHTALRILADLDRDHARVINGVGFSKIDARIGHDLAARSFLTPRQAVLGQRIVLKYKRQLDESIISRIKT